MRIAVPDWNINDSNATSQKYMEDIKDKHYQQYNYQNLQSFPNIFSTTVQNIAAKYTNDGGVARHGFMDPRDGMIMRSKCFDKRGVYSLVVDAIKVIAPAEKNEYCRSFIRSVSSEA